MKRTDDNRRSFFLGVDLGGSKILTALVGSEGNILSHDYRTTPSDKKVETVTRKILGSADRVSEQAGISAGRIRAVGIGAPGISNPETGTVFTSPHLPGWSNVPLRAIIERESGKRTFLINDANAAALGELCYGAAKNTRNFIYITISTGIGGGIVINGRLYTGAIGTAGEIGHMTIDPNGPRCNCGNSGCWETLASGSALAREARSLIKGGAVTSIPDYADGQIEKVDARAVQNAAEHGDDLARKLIARVARYFGIGLASLVNIFNPELIIISGGLSNMGDMLLVPALEVARERSYEEAYRAVRFVRAELGSYSGVLGAAAFAQQKTRKSGNRFS